MEKLINILETPKIIIISGIGLATSLWAMMSKTSLILDPAWISIILSGIPILYYAIRNLWIKKRITAPLLISTAIISCIALEEIFAAGEVAFIMALGELLEDYTIKRTKRGINKLINLAPQTARRISTQNGKDEIVPAIEIRKGDTLRILPGETIPADGIIIKGDTTVDQSIITGESLLADKVEGDTIFCGSINGYGSVDIRATNNGTDTTLQKMIALVKEAENKRAPIQRIIDIWASWLVPIAILIALGTWIFTGDIVRGVTILVVFCPCSLVMATPVSIIAGIGQATKFGVLIKSGEALEKMGNVDCIAMDKTGTLTFGNLSVSDIVSFHPKISKEELLLCTGSSELRSEHAIGKAIVKKLKESGKSPLETENFKMIPGKGIQCTLKGQKILCGNQSFLQSENIPLDSEALKSIQQFRNEGKAIVLVAQNTQCIGVIALSDTIRPETTQMVQDLAKTDTKLIILTGDSHQAAQYLAKQAGIKEIRAELLPEGKVAAIEELQKNGHKICMVGDGVNDAPALKTADVGIAIASMGSDIAIDSADISLMNDDISKITYIKKLSNAVRKLIFTNITLSMCINFIAIILSVMGFLTPVLGALVHNVGSVVVILNAAMLYERKV